MRKIVIAQDLIIYYRYFHLCKLLMIVCKELKDVISIKHGALREVRRQENKDTKGTRRLCYFKLLKI